MAPIASIASIAGLLNTISLRVSGSSEIESEAEFTMTTPSISNMTDRITTP
jgi:hypothetical protein